MVGCLNGCEDLPIAGRKSNLNIKNMLPIQEKLLVSSARPKNPRRLERRELLKRPTPPAEEPRDCLLNEHFDILHHPQAKGFPRKV